MSFLAQTRRHFLAGLQSGIAVSMIGCAPTTARAQDETLFSSQFDDLSAAMTKWGQAGGTLVINGDHDIAHPITVNLQKGVSYRLTTDKPRIVRYLGPRFHWAVCLLAQGRNRLAIDGNLSIDGGNRVSMPLFARFENVLGSDRRDCTVSGLACARARMVPGRSMIDGSPTNAYGATGMMFMGGFDRLVLRDVSVSDVTRAEGAGRRGSQGCAGIAVVALMGTRASARHVTVEQFTVSHVDSDDGWNSVSRGDMDGVLVFQSAEPGSSAPLIRDGHIVDAAGRAVKVFAPTGGGRTERLRIERSVPGPIDGAVDVAHQHGDGTIADISIAYSGLAHANPSTTIGMSSNEPRPPGFPMGPARISRITIHDTTGVAKKALFGLHQYNSADHEARRFVIEGIRDDGTSNYLFLPGSLGEFGPADIKIADAQVRLRAALFASEDRNRALSVVVANSKFSSSGEVPSKVMYDNRPVPAQLRVAVRREGSVLGLAQ